MNRMYPDTVAGPFPSPPRTFEDREERRIELIGNQPGDEPPESLQGMYEAFDPADRAQGLPPSEEAAISRWIQTIFEAGHNVIALSDEQPVGHATLVPESGAYRGGVNETTMYHQSGMAESPSPRDPHTEESANENENSKPPHELAIFVIQSHQGAGIGGALLDTLLGHGANAGIDRVWLSVERWNRRAVQLYESVGFEVVDSRTFEFEMALRLS